MGTISCTTTKPLDTTSSIEWDVKVAVGTLAATTAAELSDGLLMQLLNTASDRQVFDLLFEEVVDRYYERVGAWCYKVTRNRDWTLDLTQEVFLKAFRSIHTFRGDSRLSTWLYAITRNHCLNSLKKSRTEPDENGGELPTLLANTSEDNAHTILERTQSLDELSRILSMVLTPLEIRVMTLHYVHDLTLPDITRRLMLPNRSGAKAHIVRAHRKLKAMTQQDGWNREQDDLFPRKIQGAKRAAVA